MTRIHVLSDIHDDYSRHHNGNYAIPRDVDANVLVIAGDVAGRFSRMGRDWIEAQRRDVPVIVVPGNHCFWRASLDNEVGKFRSRLQFGHVHVLDGDAIVIDGTRLVGGTLWTDYGVVDGNVAAAMRHASGPVGLNDFRFIRTDNGTRPVRPQDLLAVHRRHRAAIEQVLATPFDGPTVVVTHHAPSARSLRDGRVTDPLDAAYASDLDDLIREHCPNLWIHGHVHRRHDYEIGATRVMANPRGYVGWTRSPGGWKGEAEVGDYDERLVVEVGRGRKPRLVDEADDEIEAVLAQAREEVEASAGWRL